MSDSSGRTSVCYRDAYLFREDYVVHVKFSKEGLPPLGLQPALFQMENILYDFHAIVLFYVFKEIGFLFEFFRFCFNALFSMVWHRITFNILTFEGIHSRNKLVILIVFCWSLTDKNFIRLIFFEFFFSFCMLDVWFTD